MKAVLHTLEVSLLLARAQSCATGCLFLKAAHSYLHSCLLAVGHVVNTAALLRRKAAARLLVGKPAERELQETQQKKELGFGSRCPASTTPAWPPFPTTVPQSRKEPVAKARPRNVHLGRDGKGQVQAEGWIQGRTLLIRLATEG